MITEFFLWFVSRIVHTVLVDNYPLIYSDLKNKLENVVMALDQSTRYSDLSLKEEELIAEGKHILCAYREAEVRAWLPGSRGALCR